MQVRRSQPGGRGAAHQPRQPVARAGPGGHHPVRLDAILCPRPVLSYSAPGGTAWCEEEKDTRLLSPSACPEQTHASRLAAHDVWCCCKKRTCARSRVSTAVNVRVGRRKGREPRASATSKRLTAALEPRRRRYMDVIEAHSQDFIDGVMASDDRVVTLTPDLEAYCIQMFAKVSREQEPHPSDPRTPSSLDTASTMRCDSGLQVPNPNL